MAFPRCLAILLVKTTSTLRSEAADIAFSKNILLSCRILLSAKTFQTYRQLLVSRRNFKAISHVDSFGFTIMSTSFSCTVMICRHQPDIPAQNSYYKTASLSLFFCRTHSAMYLLWTSILILIVFKLQIGLVCSFLIDLISTFSHFFFILANSATNMFLRWPLLKQSLNSLVSTEPETLFVAPVACLYTG